MAVPFNFIRSRNPNTTLRGALKINAIFATDDAVGTEPFQGWLADNTVVTSFNDALIENQIGRVDTDEFNPNQSNKFAFTTMSEGQRIVQRNLIVSKFQNPIDPTNGTFNKDDILEFESNALPFGTLDGQSQGKQYRIYGIVREKNILIDSVQSITDNGDSTWTVVLNTDSRENLQSFTQATSTGNNIQTGDSVVIFDNQLAANGTSTSINGTYVLTNVTSTSITYITTTDPLAGDTFQIPGKFYKITNELLLTETLRGLIQGASYNNGSNVIDLNLATTSGTFAVGQTITGPGIPTGTIISVYNTVANQIIASNTFTSDQSGVTVITELRNPQNDIVLPIGTTAAAGSPQCFLNAGAVIESQVVKLPTNYYVYGDVRLKYFWASYNPTGTLDGWDQNLEPDGIQTLYVGGSVDTGTTLQLIGSDDVFSQEDTFNNLIKTLGIQRGVGIGGDYTSTGRAALLYISATDSQGVTGSTSRGSRGSSTPSNSVLDTIETVNNAGGYWIGVIGGSFARENNEICQNEIQTFRKDSTDGIKGDPRGFTPLKGEVVTARIGVPISQIQYNAVGDPVGSVRITTYYDHQLGNPLDELRIRLKNIVAVGAAELEGLRDIVVVDSKNFYFSYPNNVGTIIPITNFDELGYVLNVTSLLNVPTGFYRKSTFNYVNPTSVNDTRTISATPTEFELSEQPGVGTGLDRKEILVTLRISETTGTLQYFSSYPVGDFFVDLPISDAFGIPYFAYPVDGLRDIKFRVKATNIAPGEAFITIRDISKGTPNDLLDPGTTTEAEVIPGEEIPIIFYPIEYTADVTTSAGFGATITNVKFFEDEGRDLGRDFTELQSGGTGYQNASAETTFFADAVDVSGGTGSGLKLDIEVDSGVVVSASLSKTPFTTPATPSYRGTGYTPGDIVTIQPPTGGSLGVAANVLLKNIDDWGTDNWTIEIIDPDNLSANDNFFEANDNDTWSNPDTLASKTQVTSNTIVDNNPNYDVTLSKEIVSNINNATVAFCFPRNDKQINVFVKQTNNFKDISITDAQFTALETEQPGKGATDVSVTFTGYGYSKGDILTPSEITNPPVNVLSAVWNRETEIAEQGFVFTGVSVIGTQSFTVSNIAGSFEGTGAAFIVTQTVTGLYNVELFDPGGDFQVSEIITIPGYNLGGSRFVRFALTGAGGTENGSGYPTDQDYVGVSTTVSTGTGDGNLTFDFSTTTSGELDILTLKVNNPGNGYEIGDTGIISGIAATTQATYEVLGTTNDLIIEIREIINNSNVTLVTTTPHEFVPPLGRTTVDIVVKDITATGNPEGSFNGRKVAQVVGNTTLKYDQLADPGIYSTGGQVINVSPDVINDTFAVYSNKLYLNLNTPSNDPVYPYLRFVSNAVGDVNRIVVTTSEPHGLSNGDEVRVSGIVGTRPFDYNTGKATVDLTTNAVLTDPTTQFAFAKTLAGNIGTVIAGTGEVTNPYIKVLGGVYTKDFYRIVFVNTTDTEQDGIPPDKTKDFLVRDINFRQISNDNLQVQDGDKHYFYITSSNEIVITDKQTNLDGINSIVVIPETVEYEVTTSTPHGMFAGNRFVLNITGGVPGTGSGSAGDYETPTAGNAAPDIVTNVISTTKFRYAIYRDGRTLPDGDPVDALGATGAVDKQIDVGSNPITDTYFGPDAGVSQDLVKLVNLKGFPGVNSSTTYYLVTVDKDVNNDPNYLTLQLSPNRSGTPISWSLDIVSATYDKTTENAIIEVSGASPHNLSNGDTISISGVTSEDYNGVKTLVEEPISPTIFTFQIPPLSAGPDLINDEQSINISTGAAAPATVVKRCNSTQNGSVLTIRGGGGRTRANEGIVRGMNVTGTGIDTGTNGPAYVDNFIASTGEIGLVDAGGNIYILSLGEGGGGGDFTFTTGVAGSYAIALDVTNLNDLAPGQYVNGTGIASNTIKVESLYNSGSDDPSETPFYYYATLDIPLTNTLSSGTYTFSDNLAGGRSIRVTGVTPVGESPKVGAEIETIGGSGNIFPAGTLITDVTVSTFGGFIISVDNDLLIDFTDQTIKIFPDTNAGSGGSVSPVFAQFDPGNPTEILNEDTAFSGEIQLTGDTFGWDHVSLAKETGGAIFFQLGFSSLATGSFNSTTITTSTDISVNLTNAIYDDEGSPIGDPAGIGVYGEGVAPGAVIVSVAGTQITLDKPNVGVVNGYVGFARPDSVSVFPKYTSEFGRILGKTFAEWLFKIA